MCADKKPQNNHLLRAIPIVNFCLTIALSVPYAIFFNRIVPVIGIIVCFLSTLLSLVCFPWQKICQNLVRRNTHQYSIVLAEDDDGEPPAKVVLSTGVLFLLDVLLVVFSLFVFVLATVEMTNTWWNAGNANILGTWATLPYLSNCGVHAYLACTELAVILRQSRKPALTNCPHCQKSLIGASSPDNAEFAENQGDRGTRMSGDSRSPVAQV